MTRSTWTLPVLITIVSLIGLIAALTGDGVRDVMSWIALGVPVVAVARTLIKTRTFATDGRTNG